MPPLTPKQDRKLGVGLTEPTRFNPSIICCMWNADRFNPYARFDRSHHTKQSVLLECLRRWDQLATDSNIYLDADGQSATLC